MTGLRQVSRILSRLAAGLSGLVLMALVVAISYDVVSRNLLNRSMRGLIDYGEIGLTALVFLAFATAQQRSEHILIDSVFDRMPRSVRPWLHGLAVVLGTTVLAAAAWFSVEAAVVSWQTSELRTGVGRVPMWPARLAVAVGFSLWTLQFVLDGLAATAGIRRASTPLIE